MTLYNDFIPYIDKETDIFNCLFNCLFNYLYVQNSLQ